MRNSYKVSALNPNGILFSKGVNLIHSRVEANMGRDPKINSEESNEVSATGHWTTESSDITR